MKKKRFFYLLISVILLGVFAACGDSDDTSTDAEADDSSTVTTTEEGKLTFGSSGLYKPFNYEELDGEMAGFEVDLGNAIAEEMGLEPNPVFNQYFGELIEEVYSERSYDDHTTEHQSRGHSKLCTL